MILLSDQDGSNRPDRSTSSAADRQSVVRWFNRYQSAGLDGLHTVEGATAGPPSCALTTARKLTRSSASSKTIPRSSTCARADRNGIGQENVAGHPAAATKKNGWSWKRFRRRPPKRPSEEELRAAVEALALLGCLAMLGYIDLRFADQSAFNLQPNVPYGWIRIGQQRGISSQKGGTLNVFGLLNLRGDLTSYRDHDQRQLDYSYRLARGYAAGISQETVIVARQCALAPFEGREREDSGVASPRPAPFLAALFPAPDGRDGVEKNET